MSHYDKILTSAPVNKTAALVTRQNNDEESEREFLVKRAQDLEEAIKSAKMHHNFPLSEIKRMGKEKVEVQEKLNFLKNNIKKKYKATIGFYFMEECKKRMNKIEFALILKDACAARDKDEKNGE